MRLLVLGGVALLASTILIVLYGFKRTEELRSESHIQEMMRQPRTASFGNVPVGLAMGLGGSAAPAENSASFDDGLVVSLVGVEKQNCADCGPEGRLVAVLQLNGGGVPAIRPAIVRLSGDAPAWADHGYVITLLSIDASSVVIAVDTTGKTP
ncbi:MAG TPA: hypothetical protein VL500_03620 [Candidatus Eisenbacteria bacterium]|nr:hypothetical protein [Candidatus Eisenbacteria bacterium]